MKILTNIQLAQACLKLAQDYKTLYVMGCFGAPLTDSAKIRYMNACSYNRQSARKTKIYTAGRDTFGFDCVGMIKGLLWDWSGNTNDVYGGGDYGKNGVPDLDANSMLKKCRDVSGNFSRIQVGEVVWMQDHIGVYTGDGFCVECSPKWKDGCQVTAVGNLGGKDGYHCRVWEKHGKLPYITYEAKTEQPVKSSEIQYTQDDFVRDIQNAAGIIIDGHAGSQTLRSTMTVSRYKNSASKMVLPIQKRLKSLGYYTGWLDGKAEGRFDDGVRNYQRAIGIRNPDGEVTAGQMTWRSLLGME